MSNLLQETQKLAPSAIVSLFMLDTSSLGGPVYRFVQSQRVGGNIIFGGLTYTPFDVTFEGLEISGIGAFATPTFTVANTGPVIQALANAYGDLNGCVVTRIRTYARFLDGEAEADPTAYFGPDTYKIERMTEDSPASMSWELSSAIDQEGKMLPGRVIIAGACMWRYRIWDPVAGVFNYGKAQCPYTGAQSYDVNDQPVAAALDVPSRQLSCCKTRFGADQPLPFGGFPGISRLV